MRLDARDCPVDLEMFDGARPFGFHAPPWARFIAADYDGLVWAFQHHPAPDRFSRSWSSTASGGRYTLLGSCRQEIPNWEAAVFHRRGGLWRAARVDEHAQREADLHAATGGALRAIAAMGLLVLAVLGLRSLFF